MNRWLYIGSVYPSAWEERFGVGSSPTIDVQRSLLAGLSRQGWRPDAILTTPPIRLFPRDRLQRFPSDLEGRVEGYPDTPLESMGITNLEPFKTAGIAGHLKSYLTAWSRRVREAGDTPRLLVYNLGPTHEQGGFLAGVCRSLSLPVIPFVTDLDYHGEGRCSLGHWRFRWQVRLLQASEKLIALNPNVLREFSEDRSSLHVPGVVPDHQFFTRLLSLPPVEKSGEPPVFLYAGSLNEPRGINRLLRAFEALPEGSAVLKVSGRGPEESRVRDLAERHRYVEYLGYLRTDDERLQVIEDADILVNPHEIELPLARYLFPSKMAEYLASGRMVVSSLLPGMDGFPVDEIELYRKDSDEELTAALQRSLDTGFSVRVDRARKCREWARINFDWDHVAGRILEFIEQPGEPA